MKKFILILIIICLGNFYQACKADTKADTTIIKAWLDTLTHTTPCRSYDHEKTLNRTANFIKTIFQKYSDSVYYQDFFAGVSTYKNVICTFGPRDGKRIIIGAHYDVCGHAPGADDNASGVVGILELARMLKGQKLNYRVDLVAFCLEEPPFFTGPNMGSYVHAQWLKDKKIKVYGMVSLEMIGYYKSERNTQKYPISAMSVIYGSRANFIGLIKKFGAGHFARKFCRKFKSGRTMKSVKLSAPQNLEGISWSDHASYWTFGFSALMITDTSFFRNPNYHKLSDSMDTLDFDKMAKVIDGVFYALIHM